MAANTIFTKAHFQQLHSEKCASLKSKMTSIYKSHVKGILMSPPFSYTEGISKGVSDGVVDYGDKLLSSVMVDSDDEGELDEVNQVGDDMQAMVDVTLLELVINDHPTESQRQIIHKLYPIPQKGFHISQITVMQFAKALEEIRNFLKMRAFQGFVAAVALLGDFSEDGVVFGGQQTVPLEVIESQVQNMLAGRGKQLAPLAVDVIMEKEGQLVVSSIKANEDDVEHFTISA